MKYYIYTRKSSEAEDKQVISVKSQIDELTKIAEQRNLVIAGTFREEKSAKDPGRPIFNKMINLLEKGEAEGILCWKLNRLTRNPIDGGTISWLLQKGVIKHIVTAERDYLPEDNVLMMNVEIGMANQFVLDLRRDTIRGMNTKISDGWYPSYAPLGYLNDPVSPQGEKKIFKDDNTFLPVRKLWDYLLTGIYSVKQITEKAREIGIRTRRTNKLLRESTLHRMFTNRFYTGKFEYKGEIYQGKHPAMVTEEEFKKAQVILGIRSKPRPQKHNFAYTGMIRCGECGAMITAEEKDKLQKNGNLHHYVYYHCTKRINKNCTQGSITEIELESQVDNFLSKVQISDKFLNWALKYVRYVNENETKERTEIYKSHQRNYNYCQQKEDKLLELLLAGTIDEEVYKNKKDIIAEEKKEAKAKLDATEQRATSWLELAEKTFNFCRYSRYWFQNGSLEDKKIILSTIGLNLSLKDKILTIEPVKLFSMMKEPQKINQWGG